MSAELETELSGIEARIKRSSEVAATDALEQDCAEFISGLGKFRELLSPDRLATTLIVLRNNRQILQSIKIAEAGLRIGIDDPALRNLYAISLIANHQHLSANAILQHVLDEIGDQRTDPQLNECLGLLGRVWKDIALHAIAHKDLKLGTTTLQRSHDYYGRSLELAPQKKSHLTWAGINLVGLLRVAELANIDLQTIYTNELTSRILEKIDDTPRDDLNIWDYGSAAELFVATGDWPYAENWLRDFTANNPNPFQLASMSRQLSQVWRVNETDEGAELYQILLEHTVGLQGGFINAEPGEFKKMFEALHGGKPGIGTNELHNILFVAKSVAQVSSSFQRIGTGFVLSADDLGLDMDELGLKEGELVLLTNSHVVSDPPEASAAVPQKVQLHFEMSGSQRTFRAKEILFNSSLHKHDVSILKIKGRLPKDIEPLSWARRPSSIEKEDRAYVIGHPQGQSTTFSIENSKLIAVEDPEGSKPQRLHYRTATDYGSSGSPVFNQDWEVIGIHSRGQPTIGRMNGQSIDYSANEGITIQSIVKRIRQDNKTAKQRKARTASS